TAWPFSKHQVLHWPVARAVDFSGLNGDLSSGRLFLAGKFCFGSFTGLVDIMLLACGKKHFEGVPQEIRRVVL
ncbi:MAG TPA: hypothetical protein PKM57_18730, partial [Kiritimatiellia bacterium]|nr:hypothetical protein [Kiritimatiellia bacterium]